MVAKRPNLGKSIESQGAGKQFGGPKVSGKMVNTNEQRQIAIKNLLETAPKSIDGKVTTLKAAHHVDKDRFQSAFRSLLSAAKS